MPLFKRSNLLQELPDRDLARRAGRGEAAAGRLLVERHEGLLLGYLRRRLGCEDRAADLFQETWSRAWRGLGSFRGQCRFSTWLIAIARRLLIDRDRHEAGASRWSEEPADPESETSRAMLSEEAELVRCALLKLAPRVAEVIRLRYLEGLSFREVGHVLGIGEATARGYLRDGLQQLAEHLQRSGLAECDS